MSAGANVVGGVGCARRWRVAKEAEDGAASRRRLEVCGGEKVVYLVLLVGDGDDAREIVLDELDVLQDLGLEG